MTDRPEVETVLPGEWCDMWRGSHDVAIVFEGEAVTYADLANRIDSFSVWMVERDVRFGDRVSWVGLNRVELFACLFACARIGAIFNPLNNRLTSAELAALIADADPTLVIVTDGFESTVREAVVQSGSSATVIDLDADNDADAEPAAHASSPINAADVDTNTDLLMVFTSGTTGRAKGAVLSQGAVAATIDIGRRTQELTSDDVIIAPLPTFHVGGLNIQTLPTLAAGGTVLLMRRFDPTTVLDLIERHRPTQTLLVPAMLTAVAAEPKFPSTDLSCLRGVMSGSSVVPDAVTAPWFERGVPVGQVYGTTETGPTAVVLGYDDARDHPGSAGKVVAPAAIRIVGADGCESAAGEPGEILLRGPNIASRYWRDPDATAASFVDGWYHTGDVGQLDPDGWLYVSDRLRDMLISGGENVYPAEVEAVLADHPAIAEIAVIGRGDERLGEVGVAFVVPTSAAVAPTADELSEWATDRLARFKHPRHVEVVDSLPRTALGKVTKHVLRERLS